MVKCVDTRLRHRGSCRFCGSGGCGHCVVAAHCCVLYFSHCCVVLYFSHCCVLYFSHCIAALCYISMFSGSAESMVDSEVDCWWCRPKSIHPDPPFQCIALPYTFAFHTSFRYSFFSGSTTRLFSSEVKVQTTWKVSNFIWKCEQYRTLI